MRCSLLPGSASAAEAHEQMVQVRGGS